MPSLTSRRRMAALLTITLGVSGAALLWSQTHRPPGPYAAFEGDALEERQLARRLVAVGPVFAQSPNRVGGVLVARTLIGRDQSRLGVFEQFSPQIDRWWMVWRGPEASAGQPAPAPSPLLWAAYLRLTGQSDQRLLAYLDAAQWSGPSAGGPALPAAEGAWRAEVLAGLSRRDLLGQLAAPCPEVGLDVPRIGGDAHLGLAPVQIGTWTLRGCSNAAGMNVWGDRAGLTQGLASQPARDATVQERRQQAPRELAGSDGNLPGVPLLGPLSDVLMSEGWTAASADTWPLVDAEAASPDAAPVTEGPSGERAGARLSGGDIVRLELVSPLKGEPNTDVSLWLRRGALMSAELSVPGGLKSSHWYLLGELAARQQADYLAVQREVTRQLKRSCDSLGSADSVTVGTVLVTACQERTWAGPRSSVRLALIPQPVPGPDSPGVWPFEPLSQLGRPVPPGPRGPVTPKDWPAAVSSQDQTDPALP